jgi:hypothetical protein
MEEGTLYIERYSLERREKSLYKRRIKQSIVDQLATRPQGDITPWFLGA